MPVEFVGSLAAGSPAASADLGLDPDWPARMAVLHEELGFDWLQVAQSPGLDRGADGIVVASQVLTATSELGVLLAHRPGIAAPTVVARQYATLAAFYPGRIAMLLDASADAASRRRDGDISQPADAGRRAADFLAIVRRAWSSPDPFDYDGEFYQVAGATSSVRPPGGAVPVYLRVAAGDFAWVGGLHPAPCSRASVRFVAGATEQVADAILAHVAAGASTLQLCGYEPEADGTACATVIRLVREQARRSRCRVA